jgi:hypothetical protein
MLSTLPILSLEAPSLPEKGDPIFLSTEPSVLIDRRVGKLGRIVDGYIVVTDDERQMKIHWNQYLGWVPING